MAIKFTNTERTAAVFGESTHITLGAPGDWDSIGDGPTRDAVKAWLAAGNVPEPMPLPDPNEAILAQIAALEQATMVPRITREGLMKFAEIEAERTADQMTAAGTPTTAQDLLMQNIGYMKTKAVDDQIRALRSQLK